ncbi:unnamed protein product [Symbiodinium sp. CCMP2592]|nr:unnamed protein product [Symbiodinium sp. CCMP2592]
MVPRPLDLQPQQAEVSADEEAFVDITFHAEAARARQKEPATLRVVTKGAQQPVLTAAVDNTTTVAALKCEVEALTGWPGKQQLLSSNGLPLMGHQVVQSLRCLSGDAELHARCADEAWVREVEELGLTTGTEARRADLLGDTLERMIESCLQESGSLKERLEAKVCGMSEKFKKATSMILGSSGTLEAAAMDLNRNRDVLFEAVPRSSKAARQAAEELMRCRNKLLSSTQGNGEVLEKSRLVLGPAHRELQELASEVHGRLQQILELLLRQSELLHLQRFRGWLSARKVDISFRRWQARQESVSLDSSVVQQVAGDLLLTRKSYRQAVATNLAAIKLANEYLQQDEAIVLNWALTHVSKERTLDRDFILSVVNANGEALEEAPPALRGDREVVLCAVKSSKGWALQFASDTLKRDPEVVLTAVRRNALSLEFAAEELRSDRQVVLAAVQVQGEALEFASADLKRDPDVVAAAIRSSRGWALQFASEELRACPATVLAAVSANGLALEYADGALRGDKPTVLAAVTSNPSALQFASKQLQEDREIVLTAVAKDGCVLQFAAGAMKADRAIVLAAIQQAGTHVLLVADKQLQADFSILEEAQQQQREKLQSARPATQPLKSESCDADAAGAEPSWSDSAFADLDKTHL